MVVERLCWEGFGFPVIISKARFMTTPSGYEVLDMDMNILKQAVLKALMFKRSTLTGSELRFIRTALEMKQAEFAKLIDVAGHSSIAQWEARRNSASGMGFHTEMVLRLKVAARIEDGLERRVLDEVVKPGLTKLCEERTLLELEAPLPHAA
jgi:DNA-binding transcriptional regulator YiaG